MKLYDIVVIDEDEETGRFEKTETGVSAHSRQELIQLYGMCGSKIRIIREYDDPNEKKPEQKLLPPPQAPIPVPKPESPKEELKNNSLSCGVVPVSPIPPQVPPVEHKKPVVVEKPPKFFTVAGIECKLDKGRIYQKQWVKLLGQEASNYRLISDKNNRELPFAGKHLEVLKWVLVEDEQSDINNSILSIING